MKLGLDDIVDQRAYERERDAFRDHIIAVKKLRRIGVGPHITVLFENRETIRFQIQEMARAERMLLDEQIQTELDIYNPLIPEPGEVSATLFIELTSKLALMDWLPRLVGIETAVQLHLADGDVVRCVVDPAHAAQLTREGITAAVHYVKWAFTPAQVETFASGAVRLVVDHPEYPYGTDIGSESVAALLEDLRGT